jgi:hypothetical protein
VENVSSWKHYICFTCRVTYNEHDEKELEKLRKLFGGPVVGANSGAKWKLHPPHPKHPECTPYGR